MNDLRDRFDKVRGIATKYFNGASRHRFVLILFIVGAAISFALLKTRSFIDISRNEDRYSEEVLLINYKEIDETILEEFQAAQQDAAVEVNPSFDPDRSNPFSE